MKKTVSLCLLLATASCNSPASQPVSAATAAAPAATPLQQSVAAYIQAHSPAFPGYEPVRWSPPAAYTKMSEAAIKGVVAMKNFDDALVPRNKALDAYKASLARHDTPAQTAAIKARYGKANKYNDSLLVIANSFIGVKDSARLGTEITHTYRTKDKAGALVLDSTTFVRYKNGKIEQL